ncbi:9-cis-epoxycarotenoid dioxygenase 1, chloroplastic [Asimina triloba]
MLSKAIGKFHSHSGITRRLLFFTYNAFDLIDSSCDTTVTNASLVYFNSRLLAIDLEIIDNHDFDDQLNSAMIAHPKIDPVSCDLFVFSYDIIRKSYLKYLRLAPVGTKSPDVEILVEQSTIIHDFTIIENLVLILDP